MFPPPLHNFLAKRWPPRAVRLLNGHTTGRNIGRCYRCAEFGELVC